MAVVTSIRVRISVSGVRSSWDALATNRRWLANAASSRASIASKVSASSFSSSGGPARASRWPRFSWQAACAAVVTAVSGRRTRRLTAQPSPAASKVPRPSPASENARKPLRFEVSVEPKICGLLPGSMVSPCAPEGITRTRPIWV